MKKRYVILTAVLATMMLAGCAESTTTVSDTKQVVLKNEAEQQNETEDIADTTEPANFVVVDEEQMDSQEANSNTAEPSDDTPEADPAMERDLKKEELYELTEFIQKWDAYGFLMSEYEVPQEVDLGEVFYSGAGIQQSYDDEEIMAYLQAMGEEELFTDCIKVTSSEIDQVVQRRLGLTIEEVDLSNLGTYLPEYDAYYHQCGDTNYMSYRCEDGTVNGDIYTVSFVLDHDTDWKYGMLQTVLQKTEEGYRFISNKSMVQD